MSQSPRNTSTDAEVQSIMTALIATYGSLAEPDFSKVYEKMNSPIHRNVVAELRGQGMDVLETTDENDDVSTQLVISRSGDQAYLELSGIGPFAAMIHLAGNEQGSWVIYPDKGPTPLATLVATVVEQAGFRLLSREIVLKTVRMNRPDGSTEVTLYRALFTDTDRIP